MFTSPVSLDSFATAFCKWVEDGPHYLGNREEDGALQEARKSYEEQQALLQKRHRQESRALVARSFIPGEFDSQNAYDKAVDRLRRSYRAKKETLHVAFQEQCAAIRATYV